MHTILLTHGRHHETISGAPVASHEVTKDKLIEHAIDLLRQTQRLRRDGLPDGYRILDEKGSEVVAKWLGLLDSKDA